MNRSLTLLLLAGLISLAACNQESIANRGFSLPEGDIEQGKLVFMSLGCVACHSLANSDINAEDWSPDGFREIEVELGGAKASVQTYGDLVTSIINPSHRIAKHYPIDEVTSNGKSLMINYNRVMRVEDLVNVVTFLKSKYTLREVPLANYPVYIYPTL
ncbi:MAG: sulfur-oxidizing protein SoxX [Arenicella sp.]|jgi:sulfur-oxidizing protein SoxX